MTEPADLIDIERVEETVEQYAETDDRARQRELENEVLAATVWRTEQDQEEDQLTLDRAEVQEIHSALPDDALEARQLLRQNDVEKL